MTRPTDDDALSLENVDRTRRGYEAFSAGDLEAVLEFIDPDVQVEIHTGRPDLPETETLHGHAGFLENLRQLTEVFDEIEIEPEEFIEAGENLVVVVHAAGRGKGSGIRVENRVTHIWTIRDGMATRFRVYSSKEQALEAAGLAQS
jgi:ketosteroid isomerase-like protein